MESTQNLAGQLRSWLGDATTTRLPFGATTLRPAFDEARAFGADPLQFLRERAGHHDVLRLHLGFTEFHLVLDPELVRRVLVTDDALFGEGKWTQRGRFVMRDCLITAEGDPHRERRRILQPAFQNFDGSAHAAEMAKMIDEYTADWRDGQTLEMRTAMGRIALAIASRFLFGEDPQRHHAGAFADLWTLNTAISRPPIPHKRLRTARRRLLELAAKTRGGPVVDSLRSAGIAEASIDHEIIALWIASIDTTPGTLSWLWMRLAEDEQLEADLYTELVSELATSAASLRDLGRLPMMNRIVSEVLRLHPPVRFVDRRALDDMDFGSARLKAGDYLLLSPFFTHRDERYWTEPDTFRPGRWEGGERDREARRAYFPFGAGPHACIGGPLAQREIGAIVSTLARRWRFLRSDAPIHPHRIPPSFPMRVEARP